MNNNEYKKVPQIPKQIIFLTGIKESINSFLNTNNKK